ncbi:hypothetical protein AB5I41_29710 [Sphingomonas sp. MMS24-JH45]
MAQVVRDGDLASPGWAGMLGFGFFVKTMVMATSLSALPPPIAAPLVGLALAGWAAWRDPLAMRVLATLGAMRCCWRSSRAPTPIIGGCSPRR